MILRRPSRRGGPGATAPARSGPGVDAPQDGAARRAVLGGQRSYDPEHERSPTGHPSLVPDPGGPAPRRRRLFFLRGGHRRGHGVRSVGGGKGTYSITLSSLLAVPLLGLVILSAVAPPVRAVATWAGVASGCPAR